jgi:predicted nucleotidyltransferase
MARPSNNRQGRPEQGSARSSRTAEVPTRFIERIVEVLHPEEIWLFGSRARGTHHPESDWDFMAVLPDDAPEEHLNLVEVWRQLRDLRLQRVEVFPVRRRDFEEGRRLLGTLSQIVSTEGRPVHG